MNSPINLESRVSLRPGSTITRVVIFNALGDSVELTRQGGTSSQPLCVATPWTVEFTRSGTRYAVTLTEQEQDDLRALIQTISNGPDVMRSLDR